MSIDSSRHTANRSLSSASTCYTSDAEGNYENKPVLPYTLGATFTAYRHEPPAPFGHGYDTPWPPFKSGDFRLTQIEYCISRKPLEGRTLPESCTLTVTSLIRTGYSCGAQVVVVNGNMAAKIYDPLYDNGLDCYDNKRDVVVLADGDYSREAAAYEELQRAPGAEAQNCTPEYYGSWTIEVETALARAERLECKNYTRHVRLLLMEYIQVAVMSSISSLLLRQQVRSHILERVLQAEAVIFQAGVYHRDVSPRNVMIVESDSSDPDVRIIIIDFNVSTVRRLGSRSAQGYPNDGDTLFKWPGKMLGPIPRFWDNMAEFEVRDWVPDNAGAANNWLWEHFGGKDEYIPLVRDEEKLEECPQVVGAFEILDQKAVEGIAGTTSIDSEDEVVFRGWRT
ncbi:hypothetical protein EJ02DRAFT_255594 [Clathrospora elynae]|uniref:non-specific serine/threonine protein kinase n=1 Tax=Clathrospora elynae TaxID=706981 RepID=A0A6A5SJ75_9PLEO|nr:hypothetical protein EJ02DRAFT_255594 [Clathrospora elynae]